MGKFDSSNLSCGGLLRAKALYGHLDDQLSDETSFAFQVQHMLRARQKYGIVFGELTSPPPETEPGNKGVCILPMRLSSEDKFALTLLNFGCKSVEEEVDLTELLGVDESRVRGQNVIDISKDDIEDDVGLTVSRMGRVVVEIPGRNGKTLMIKSRPALHARVKLA